MPQFSKTTISSVDSAMAQERRRYNLRSREAKPRTNTQSGQEPGQADQRSSIQRDQIRPQQSRQYARAVKRSRRPTVTTDSTDSDYVPETDGQRLVHRRQSTAYFASAESSPVEKTGASAATATSISGIAGTVQLKALCNELDLPRAVTNAAIRFYGLVQSAEEFADVNGQALMAACVFFACRKHHVPRSFRRVTELAGVPEHEIGLIFSMVQTYLRSRRLSRESVVTKRHDTNTVFTPRRRSSLFASLDASAAAHAEQDLGAQSPIVSQADEVADKTDLFRMPAPAMASRKRSSLTRPLSTATNRNVRFGYPGVIKPGQYSPKPNAPINASGGFGGLSRNRRLSSIVRSNLASTRPTTTRPTRWDQRPPNVASPSAKSPRRLFGASPLSPNAYAPPKSPFTPALGATRSPVSPGNSLWEACRDTTEPGESVALQRQEPQLQERLNVLCRSMSVTFAQFELLKDQLELFAKELDTLAEGP